MILSISIFAGFLGLAVFIFYLFKHSDSKNLVTTNLKNMQDTLEGLQRNLLLAQKEAERSQEMKSSIMRQELQDTLQGNRKEMQQTLLQTSQILEQKTTQLDQRLDQRLHHLSQNVSDKLEKNLKEGFLHFEKIQSHLKQAELQLQNLNMVGQSINDLNSLLKLPHLRGNFGEALLEQILNELLPLDCYELQYRINPDSTERVDAVIKYPTHVLPIDSKFPREQILPLFETQDPTKLELARKTLADILKTLAKDIRDKYIKPEHGTTDMALLFIPSETLYFEVIRNVKLASDLSKLKIFTVSPNTLAVTLHAISLSKTYYEMAKGVEKTIQDIRKSQQHFKNFEARFNDIGSTLTKAQNTFNMASTHLSRFQSSVTRLTGESPEDTQLPPSAPSSITGRGSETEEVLRHP